MTPRSRASSASSRLIRAKITGTDYGYRDSNHRLESAQTVLDTTLAQNLAYTWDSAGNLLTANDLVSGGLHQSFSYDSLHRLATANGTDPSSTSYPYGRHRKDPPGTTRRGNPKHPHPFEP